MGSDRPLGNTERDDLLRMGRLLERAARAERQYEELKAALGVGYGQHEDAVWTAGKLSEILRDYHRLLKLQSEHEGRPKPVETPPDPNTTRAHLVVTRRRGLRLGEARRASEKARLQACNERNEWQAAIQSVVCGALPSPVAARSALRELVQRMETLQATVKRLEAREE